MIGGRDPAHIAQRMWRIRRIEDHRAGPEPLPFATRERFDRVGGLVEGFETPFGLELLSTVHWTATQGDPPANADVVTSRIHAWGDRKKQFTPRQVRIALDVLADKGWIAPVPAGASA